MGFKKPGFFALLWLLLTGLLAGSHAGNSHAGYFPMPAPVGSGISQIAKLASGPSQVDKSNNQVNKSRDQVGKPITHLHLPSFFSSIRRATSDQRGNDEKRHKKTLLSEAFVPDFSIDAPPVIYFHTDYSLFLPDGCTQKAIGNFSLRGPPSLG